MANKKQLAILKKGVKAWNEWRKKNPDVVVDLRKAQLDGAILSKVDLQLADCYETDFSDANLSEAIFVRTNLVGAKLNRADLTRANLRGADIRYAELVEANLLEVDLEAAILRGADLHDANLTKCIFGNTVIGEVDLSSVQGLDTIKEHIGRSTIGIEVIYFSKGKIPEVFLRGCGVPENLITFMHSLTGNAFEFYSCFISHSTKDKRFCERLYADLQAKGVRVWYFPEDAKWGEPVWGEIDRSIKVYDKLIVVCSENSLQSGPVNREIERALVREDNEGKGILFPIRIDDYIFDTWEHERKADVLRKVVGDFSGWDKDAAKYDKAFDKLLKGLQAA